MQSPLAALAPVAWAALDRWTATPAWTGTAALGIGAERALAVATRSRRRLPGPPFVTWHEGGEGPPLLLLNGWTASGLVWPEQWVAALERRHRVIRVDNRGTGWSRVAPMPFTVADMAADAAEVLEATGGGPAAVLGFSLGGMLAQDLALTRPDLVERLYLVASRPPAPAAVNRSAPVLRTLAARRRGTVDEFIRDLWANFCAPGFAAAHPDLMAELVAQTKARGTPRRTVMRQAQAAAAWTGPRRLRHLTAPTVVVHGALDPVTPPVNSARLARLIRHASHYELSGVGHCVPLEAADRLLDIMEAESPGYPAMR